MAEGDPTIHCPLCGNKVPFGITKCPVCATPLDNAPSLRSREGLGPPGIDDYLHKDIPKVDIHVSNASCPLCGKALEGGEVKCPRCGTPLVSENEMLECPECGALASPGAKSCPKCGVGFDDTPEVPGPPTPNIVPPVPPPIPWPTPVPEPPPVPTRAIARAPQTAPSSRDGLVNGRGAVNGTGLVNGTGMTNGTKMEGRVTGRPGRRDGSFITRWQFLAVLVAVVVIVPTFFYISYVQKPGAIEIDGKFNDWAGVNKLGMDVPVSAASINVDQWAVDVQGSSVSLYIKVQSGLMISTAVDSFYLFIDSDSPAKTGYAVSGIGADYMMEIDGWNGTVQSATASRYSDASDHLNWSHWAELGSISVASASNQLECRADLPEAIPSTAKLVLMSQNPLDQRAVSYAVPIKGGLLVIRQELNSANAPNGVVAGSTSVQFLRLRMLAQGSDGTVSAIAPSVVGATLVPGVSSRSLTQGQEVVVDIAIDTSACLAGTLVTASVLPEEVTSSFAAVNVLGPPAKAYALSPPSDIVIDGAFGDWTGAIAPDTDSVPISNPDVDITATGAVNTTVSSSFYVSVKGGICNGTFVPAFRMRPTGTPGGGGVVVRITGEDFLRVYVDSDRSAATGLTLSSGNKTIGADHLIEVRGFYGQIVRTSFSSFISGTWTEIHGVTILAANDLSRIELAVAAASLDGSSSIDFIIETSDWRSRSDLATSVPQSTRGAGSIMTGAGILSWAISNTNSPTATAMSYQRKLFYDGTNIWSFYSDGVNTVCRYSTDGVTWSASSRVFVTAGVLDASIWYDQANLAVYATGDRTPASRNVYVQKGTVAPATHTITWAASDTTVVTSTVNLGSKNVFISRDANGYVWLLSSNCTLTAPARYDLSAFRSTTVDSVTAWTWSGSMLGATPAIQPNLVGSILPAGTGSDMWAVYGYAGQVASRKFTGTWGAQQNIFIPGGAATAQTDLAPPSAVVGANGVIQVVYGDDHQQPAGTPKPHIYYTYNNTATTWAASVAISGKPNNDGFVYPTLSLDSSTGNLYALSIRISDQNIIGWRSVGGTWGAQLYGAQTAFVKQYLTSIYSAPGESLICWQWTQNTTVPIQVTFDRLPEFGDFSIPVIFLCALLIVVGRRKLRK